MRFVKSLVIAGMVGCAFALASAAHAQAQQFASFSQGTTAIGSPFAFDTYTGLLYLTDGTTSTASYSYTDSNNVLHTGTYAKYNQISTINVNFQFQTANGYGVVSNNIAATMSFTAQAVGNAANSGPPFNVSAESFNHIQISFQALTAKTGLDGLSSTNLLTVNTDKTASQTTGNFLSSSSSTGGIQGTQSAGNANIVGYASDFLDFVNPNFADKDFSLSFSGITPGVSVSTNPPGTGNLNSFLANGSGVFSSDPLPPAPATPGETSAMIGIAVAGAQFGMVRYRRRRAAKKQAA